MTKKDIKDIFREKKVQLGDGTIEMIEDHIRREVREMANRCKQGNVKRLTTELFAIAMGTYGISPRGKREKNF